MLVTELPPASGDKVSRRRIVVKLNGLVPLLAPNTADLPAVAARLESWGVDGVVLGQHLFYDAVTGHPGSVRLDPERISLDPLITLAAIGASTEKLRLMTGAIVAPLHSPPALGKAVATLDVLTRGRVELGVVAGWQHSEFAALGVPYDERFARLEEVIAFCRVMWGGSPFTFNGRFTQVADAYSKPTPVQGPALPVHIGGGPTRVVARRVARLGDGWIASEGAGPAEVMEIVRQVDVQCADADRRSRLRFRATAQPAGAKVDDVVRAVADLFEAGATDVTVALAELAAREADAEKLLDAALDVAHG
jgi:probable F420-dependent oxidoreductase